IDYEDCGVMVLAGECDPEKCEELFDAMQAEAVKLTRDGPRPEEVQRVKNRRRTSLAIESESPYYRLGQLLDDVDYRGGPRTVEQRLAEVDAVSRKSIGEYLEEYPITEGGHVISVGPRDWIPSN
ncbi:MAG: insulinase family protein, partial [Planctomycetes bacterium]|nr:insulinase family protein [Planctomycetota bacterium]